MIRRKKRKGRRAACIMRSSRPCSCFGGGRDRGPTSIVGYSSSDPEWLKYHSANNALASTSFMLEMWLTTSVITLACATSIIMLNA